jgi:hypothetical protein
MARRHSSDHIEPSPTANDAVTSQLQAKVRGEPGELVWSAAQGVAEIGLLLPHHHRDSMDHVDEVEEHAIALRL